MFTPFYRQTKGLACVTRLGEGMEGQEAVGLSRFGLWAPPLLGAVQGTLWAGGSSVPACRRGSRW